MNSNYYDINEKIDETQETIKKLKRIYTSSVLVVNEDLLKEIEILSGRGLTVLQMSQYYGCNIKTFRKRCKEHPEMFAAVRKGKTKMIAHVSNSLLQKVKEGNVPAMMFYLKTQACWREVDPIPDPDLEDEEIKEMKIDTDDPIEASRIYQKYMNGGRDE